MKFFEDLGAVLGSGARTVADKTKELSGIAAIKAQIGTAQASLGKLYKELGKAYYEDHKEDAMYAEKMAEIKAVLDKIDSLNAKLSTADAEEVAECVVKEAEDNTVKEVTEEVLVEETVEEVATEE